MHTRITSVGISVLSLTIVGAWPSVASATPIVLTASGANAAAIQATVDNFRTALGTLNPNNGSAFASGRREINWDAVPDAMADPNLLPGDFFASTSIAGRARGLTMTTPGTGFMVSSNAGTVSPIDFGFPADFIPFSAQRMFTPVGSLITDITFFVPGTLTAATVSGFGAIFNDVETANASSIQFFGLNGASLASQTVPISVSGGLSFVGVRFDAGERVGRVRITSGATPFLSNGNFANNLLDGVVMDDFIYAEPLTTVPEPSTMLLVATGTLVALGSARSRRRSRK
jgi:hypothetical protein